MYKKLPSKTESWLDHGGMHLNTCATELATKLCQNHAHIHKLVVHGCIVAMDVRFCTLTGKASGVLTLRAFRNEAISPKTMPRLKNEWPGRAVWETQPCSPLCDLILAAIEPLLLPLERDAKTKRRAGVKEGRFPTTLHCRTKVSEMYAVVAFLHGSEHKPGRTCLFLMRFYIDSSRCIKKQKISSDPSIRIYFRI